MRQRQGVTVIERTIRFIFEDGTRHMRALRFKLRCSSLFCPALPPVRSATHQH